MITINDDWKHIVSEQGQEHIDRLLPRFLKSTRWFGGKAKTIRSAHISDVVHLDEGETAMALAFVEVTYDEGGLETYALPITAAFGPAADRIRHEHANAIIGSLKVVGPHGTDVGLLHDAVWNEACGYYLLHCMGRRTRVKGSLGTLVASTTMAFDRTAVTPEIAPLSVMKAEQSNTSLKFGDRMIMKLYRRLDHGVNPELEIGRTLTSRKFRHAPALIGALEYLRDGKEPITLALAQMFVPNKGDAWQYTLRQLSRYFDCVSALRPHEDSAGSQPIRKLTKQLAGGTRDLFLGFLEAASLLGRRTAELHLVLSQYGRDPAFTPEVCSPAYLQFRFEAMRQLIDHSLALLRSQLPALSPCDRSRAQQILEREGELVSRCRALVDMTPTAMRIRCHGDYHLGQVLFTGQDFVIIDYEGEPARPLAERRTKHIPVLDVAGMIRSFQYAAHVALRHRSGRPAGDPDVHELTPWADHWFRTVKAAFLKGYVPAAGDAPFLPQSRQEFDLLLGIHLLEKSVYELAYELNNRPDWVTIPLRGILHLIALSSHIGHVDDLEALPDDDRDPCSVGSTEDEVHQ